MSGLYPCRICFHGLPLWFPLHRSGNRLCVPCGRRLERRNGPGAEPERTGPMTPIEPSAMPPLVDFDDPEMPW